MFTHPLKIWAALLEHRNNICIIYKTKSYHVEFIHYNILFSACFVLHIVLFIKHGFNNTIYEKAAVQSYKCIVISTTRSFKMMFVSHCSQNYHQAY